jgi:hypothetical protein
MSDRDIRAKILGDIYTRKRAGMEIRTTPKQYADFLGISEDVANFNIQYLIDAGLVKGESVGSLGTTKKFSFLYDLTSFGVEAVEEEGLARQGLAVNFNLVNVNAPVKESQIAAGGNIHQTLNINTMQDLQKYLDQNFPPEKTKDLKNQMLEVESQIKAGSVKTDTLSKVREAITSLGAGASLMDAVVRLIILMTTH